MTQQHYKSHPSRLTPKTAHTVANLGPESIASSPEAMLIAGVIRQAVEDFQVSEESIERASLLSYESRKKALRRQRGKAAASKFLFHELEEFLSYFEVSHLFHRETILRKVNKAMPVEPESEVTVVPTRLAQPFEDRLPIRMGFATRSNFIDRLYPQQQGLCS